MAASAKRIALRDHAVQVVPDHMSHAFDLLEEILNNAGLQTPAHTRMDLVALLPVMQPLLARFADEAEAGGNAEFAQLLAEIKALRDRSWIEVRYDLAISFAGVGLTAGEQQAYNALEHEFIMGMHEAFMQRANYRKPEDSGELSLSHFVGFAVPIVVYGDLVMNVMRVTRPESLRVFASRGPHRVDFDANFELLFRVLKALRRLQREDS